MIYIIKQGEFEVNKRFVKMPAKGDEDESFDEKIDLSLMMTTGGGRVQKKDKPDKANGKDKDLSP